MARRKGHGILIYEILGTGAENKIPGGYICTLLGITRQELSRQVMKERRQGKPICAISGGGEYGYFLAKDRREMEAFCRSLKHRSDEILKTRRVCMKTAKRLPDGRTKGSGPGK